MDSLIPENFMFESTLDKTPIDAQSYLVKNKNLTSFIDQQRGSGAYTSSKVIIDCQLGNGTDFVDWREAYVTLPYHYKLSCTAGSTSTVAGAIANNFFTTPKNCSLIESMRVEQGGRVDSRPQEHRSPLADHTRRCRRFLDAQDGVADPG